MTLVIERYGTLRLEAETPDELRQGYAVLKLKLIHRLDELPVVRSHQTIDTLAHWGELG